MSRSWRAIRLLLVVIALHLLQVQESSGAQQPFSGRLPDRLVVAVLENGDPLEGVKDGQLTGFSGELFTELLAGSGTTLELRRYARRDETMRAACRGEVDL